MNLLNFTTLFPDEASCKAKWKEYRDKQGVVCPRCGSIEKSFSASELQRQLGHSTYNPIWAMLHKLRQVMGMRDARYQLSQVVELDEGFYSTEMDEEEKDKPLKRGRGQPPNIQCSSMK